MPSSVHQATVRPAQNSASSGCNDHQHALHIPVRKERHIHLHLAGHCATVAPAATPHSPPCEHAGQRRQGAMLCQGGWLDDFLYWRDIQGWAASAFNFRRVELAPRDHGPRRRSVRDAWGRSLGSCRLRDAERWLDGVALPGRHRLTLDSTTRPGPPRAHHGPGRWHDGLGPGRRFGVASGSAPRGSRWPGRSPGRGPGPRRWRAAGWAAAGPFPGRPAGGRAARRTCAVRP